MMKINVLLVLAVALSLCLFSAGCEKPKPADDAMAPDPQTPEDMSAGMDTGPVPPGPMLPPPAVETTMLDESGDRTYTVQKGDGLMSIARTQLGNASRWKEIAALNPEILPPAYAIKVGQVIKLPAK